MGNAFEGTNHGLSLCMRINDFVADLLKMFLFLITLGRRNYGFWSLTYFAVKHLAYH